MFAVGELDGTLRRVNAAWQRSLGWSDDELVGRPFIDLIHPDDVETVPATGTAAVSYEIRLRARDGSHRWVLVSARSDETTGESYIVAKDIDARRAAEEHLRSVESELRFRIGLEDLVTGMSNRFFGVPEDELQQIV